MVSVGLDDDHVVGVWDWQSQQRIGGGAGGKDKILGVHVHPDGRIVTNGVKHLHFWSMGEDGALRGERARFGKKGKLQTVLCCAFAADGSTLTGMSDGKVYRWNGKQLESVHGVKGWKQAVVSIVVTPHSVVIGGRKGIAFLSLPDLAMSRLLI